MTFSRNPHKKHLRKYEPENYAQVTLYSLIEAQNYFVAEPGIPTFLLKSKFIFDY